MASMAAREAEMLEPWRKNFPICKPYACHDKADAVRFLRELEEGCNGTDADTDGFVDGATGITLNATGFKGFYPCNGVLGMSGGNASAAATATADEVEIVASGDPGADTTVVLKFMGISSSSDAS